MDVKDPDQLLNLFPLEAVVTKEMIRKARKRDPAKNLGALALKHALGENVKYLSNEDSIWAFRNGYQVFGAQTIRVSTSTLVDFNTLKEPIKLLFIAIKIPSI